ncbi:hypothetical protein ACSL103130_05020 [Actinomyces slackii]|uniref:Uncharacterized protein n=1 Tax=Actinomyces slackii TaxID=52774 RepID=A0A448KDG1_9ACTO|nr:hypothetical protein [Actinomyces slackii]VEG74958.1 Uncharacterised protein [Actinomyces slackii]
MSSSRIGGEQRSGIALQARRTARRLLSGAGSAAVTAYRVDPAAPAAFVAHALCQDGRILIAACPAPGEPLAIAPAGLPVEVRMDITLDAAEPGVRITAATAHLLGTLTWIDEADTALALASARTPACHCAITGEDPIERIADVSGWPGGRLGVLVADRVMLHCVTGVSGHAIGEILDLDSESPSADAWGSQEALAAHEAVTAVGPLGLQAICDAVRDSAVPGWVCSRRPAVGVCASLWGRTLCVDVDAHGTTLMHITSEEVVTLVVAFPHGPVAAGEVGQVLEDLAAELLPQRLTRP